MSGLRSNDRRVTKTKALLHDALAGLIKEKPYEEIVVKEILARANVGRSTFYAHYQGKDDLLDSGIQDMLRGAKRSGDLLWFSLPMFQHIERHRQRGGDATMDPRGWRALHERLERAVTQLVMADCADRGSRDLWARWIASTFVLVLDWWVEKDGDLTARDAERQFRRLIEPALANVRA